MLYNVIVHQIICNPEAPKPLFVLLLFHNGRFKAQSKTHINIIYLFNGSMKFKMAFSYMFVIKLEHQ